MPRVITKDEILTKEAYRAIECLKHRAPTLTHLELCALLADVAPCDLPFPVSLFVAAAQLEAKERKRGTFLEWLCEKYIGKPLWKGPSGTTFVCPLCEHKHFNVMPHKEPYKDRFRCHRCDEFGDEHDLLRIFGFENYDERLQMLEKLRKQFDGQGR